MVKHIILWTLDPALTEEEKQVVKAGIKEGLEGLVGKVPGLVDLKVQIDGRLASSTADLMLDCTLESKEALEVYAKHPEHLAVANTKVRPFTVQRACLDFVSEELVMQTERLTLRPWFESDAEGLYKYASDPEVGPRAGWPPHKSVEESLDAIRKFFLNDYTWAVELKETGEVIGCVGYLPASSSNLKIGQDQCEVGYWIARPYWNKGICTEALRRVMDYCFNEKGFTTLWGTFFISNPASGRVMEKCGFVDTGEETRCPNLEVGSDLPVRVMRKESGK